MEDVQRFTQLAAIGLCALSLLFALSQIETGSGPANFDRATVLQWLGKSLSATLRVFALSIAALAAAAAGARDLEVFKSDPEFQTLLYLAAP
ncbi:MAG: hypothetical protein B7Z15_07045 [Rhizobiales bacterium 32-66-8]|nr:MAG: hypothetical protein B7Z15_07045 [Rhizobiales bacterium 32-66-8]